MANALRLTLLIVAALLPGIAPAAESVKLRPLAPIYVDTKGGGIRQPEGVGCAGGSLIVVADTGNARLLTYAVSGETVAPRGEYALPQLPYPVKVQMNSKGEFLALDGKSRRIVRVSPAGEFKGYVETGGVAGTVVARSFRIDRDDNMIILDVFGSRLIIANPEGKATREIPFPGSAAFFSDLAVDRKGDVFLIDSVGRKVFALKKDSREISVLTEGISEDVNFPTSIAVDARGRLFVGDQNGGGIVIFGADGSFRGRQLAMGWKEAFLRYPSDLCISGDGLLYIADRGNNRVQTFLIQD